MQNSETDRELDGLIRRSAPDDVPAHVEERLRLRVDGVSGEGGTAADARSLVAF